MRADPVLAKLIDDLKQDPERHGQYTLENGLYYKGRLVLAESSSRFLSCYRNTIHLLQGAIQVFIALIVGCDSHCTGRG